MDTPLPVVEIACDRCHRPRWTLEHVSDGLGERVRLDGPRIGDGAADTSAYWQGVIRGPEGRRYSPVQGGRPGAYIVTADREFGAEREKLICIGRKHPRHERVVTRSGWTRAYFDAIAAGRTRIAMRDIG